jgi:heme o synthase
MGWTAATGRIEAPGLGLFAILFFWQLPHFIAIALFRKAEYRAAGLTSLPLEKGDGVARWAALGYALALVGACAVPVLTGSVGTVYAVAASILNAGQVSLIAAGVRSGDVRWARRVFAASLVFLTGLVVALGVDRLTRH